MDRLYLPHIWGKLLQVEVLAETATKMSGKLIQNYFKMTALRPG